MIVEINDVRLSFTCQIDLIAEAVVLGPKLAVRHVRYSYASSTPTMSVPPVVL